MRARTYGGYKIELQPERIKEYAPVSYGRFTRLLNEYSVTLYDLYNYQKDISRDNVQKHELEELSRLFSELRDEVYAITGVDIYIEYINSKTDDVHTNEAVFSAKLELSEPLKKLGAKVVLYRETK